MTKEMLIDWLDAERHSNEWLADECGVKVATVNSWRSNRPIPAKAVLIIENLMRIDQAKREAVMQTPQNLVLDFQTEEFDAICRAAAARTQIPRVWAKERLLELADMSPEQIEDLARTISKDQGKDARPNGTTG